LSVLKDLGAGTASQEKHLWSDNLPIYAHEERLLCYPITLNNALQSLKQPRSLANVVAALIVR